jgi:cytosine/adenosine deaminase-related metal-dependent hydrolase
MGIRGTVSVQSIDGECPATEKVFTRTRDTDTLLAATEALLERHKDDPSGRLRAMPTALWQLNASDELLKGTAALAEKYDTPWGSHLAVTAKESEVTRRYFGIRAVERLQRLGVLSPRLISAHTSYADDEEFGWLVKAGVHLTYSPQTYGVTGESSITKTGQILRFMKAHAPVTLSSDGGPLPIGYMPEVMRMGWLACNDAAEDIAAVTPMRALSMGTRLGAESLGWSSEIGSLTAGKKADFVMVPIDDWRYEGVLRPLNSFLTMGGTSDIDTVVVDGRILIEGRSCTFVDERALSAAFLQASRQVAEAHSP